MILACSKSALHVSKVSFGYTNYEMDNEFPLTTFNPFTHPNCTALALGFTESFHDENEQNGERESPLS